MSYLVTACTTFDDLPVGLFEDEREAVDLAKEVLSAGTGHEKVKATLELFGRDKCRDLACTTVLGFEGGRPKATRHFQVGDTGGVEEIFDGR